MHFISYLLQHTPPVNITPTLLILEYHSHIGQICSSVFVYVCVKPFPLDSYYSSGANSALLGCQSSSSVFNDCFCVRWMTPKKHSFLQLILSMKKNTGSDVDVLTVNVDLSHTSPKPQLYIYK